MDIRNVQKTGNMHYLYLPTAWCKKHKLTSKSKVSTVVNEDGTLNLSAEIKVKKKKELVVHVKEDNLAVLHKLILACYLAPAAGFKIMLEKTIDSTKLLDQKKLISLDLVEINSDSITCEGSVVIEDVGSLLKTMLRKIKNMIIIIMKNEKKNNTALINRYEEEIDRSQLLLDKSITEAFTIHHASQLRIVELHYISLLAKDLERLVDILSILNTYDEPFLKRVLEIIDALTEIITGIGALDFTITPEKAIAFIKKVELMENVKVKDIATYEKKRVKEHLNAVAEVIIDWALLRELDEETK